jgi:hypothetical protein
MDWTSVDSVGDMLVIPLESSSKKSVQCLMMIAIMVICSFWLRYKFCLELLLLFPSFF